MIESLRIARPHLYTAFLLFRKGAESTDIKLIGSVTESLHPNLDGIETVLEKWLSLKYDRTMTISEKGYCADPATGKLDRNNALVIADLANLTQPKSALGYIVQALKIRRERGLPPFMVMSCDNVQENGHVAKAAIIEFAQLLDPELRDWIETHVTFPLHHG